MKKNVYRSHLVKLLGPLLLIAVIAAACGDDTEDSPATVIGPGSSSAVQTIGSSVQGLTQIGFLFVGEDGILRLCGALAESDPPQCGDEIAVLENPNDVDLGELDESGNVRWSTDWVAVDGTITDDGPTIIESVG